MLKHLPFNDGDRARDEETGRFGYVLHAEVKPSGITYLMRPDPASKHSEDFVVAEQNLESWPEDVPPIKGCDGLDVRQSDLVDEIFDLTKINVEAGDLITSSLGHVLRVAPATDRYSFVDTGPLCQVTTGACGDADMLVSWAKDAVCPECGETKRLT